MRQAKISLRAQQNIAENEKMKKRSNIGISSAK